MASRCGHARSAGRLLARHHQGLIMSVQPGQTFKRYDANGLATVYAIPFLLLDAADLQITLNGTPVTTGFTLSGIGNPQSSCTFSNPPTGDLLFQMVVPFQRLADYQINGDFLAQTVNRDFDRLWLAVKQLNRDSNRALTVSLLEPEGIPPLPVKAVRGLKMLAFDAAGNPITSNLTLAQLEQQPALALGSAAQAAESANAAHLSEVAAASSELKAHLSEVAAATYASDPWFHQPIGAYIALRDDQPGVSVPPINSPLYRYIKLTISDPYNTGVLSAETSSGSAPLVVATAVISLSGSPMNGATVNLINTERRVLRAGSSGVTEFDSVQSHGHSENVNSGAANSPDAISTYAGGLSGSSAYNLRNTTTTNVNNVAVGSPISNSAGGTLRTGNETRAKSIGVTYYMRIK